MNRYLLTFYMILTGLWVQSQNILTDSLVIRTYASADFRASSDNYQMTQDENNILYFGNENGVLEFDGVSWRIHPLPSYGHVVMVKMGPDKRLYVGGENEFGYMERDSDGALTYHSLRQTLNEEIELEEIWDIFFHDNKVYFQSYESLIIYDGELSVSTGLKDTWRIFQNEHLYLSIIEEGLGVLKDGEFEYLNTKLRLEDDSPQGTVDWFGSEKILATEYNGLYILDTLSFETRIWESQATDSLSNAWIWQVEEWNDSSFVVSTADAGIYWIHKNGSIIRHFTKQDGLFSNESINLAIMSNSLWVSGWGLTNLNWPDYMDPNEFNCLIRYLTFNGQKYYLDSQDTTLTLTQNGPVSFEISYATPGLDNSDLEYAHFLDGWDTNWSDWNSDYNREFTNLDPGTYTFHVKSRVIDGMAIDSAQLTIIVPSAWYQLPWFKVMSGLAIWFVIIGIFKFRTRQLKARNKRLEALVTSRTEELKFANEELVDRNYELDQFVKRVSHDLMSPIHSAKALMDMIRQETAPENLQKCYDLMDQNLVKQKEFVSKMLEQSINANEVRKESFKLRELIQDVINELKMLEGAEAMTFELSIAKDLVLSSDTQRLKIIFKNLIENAIKYRKPDAVISKITIAATQTEKKVKVKLQDDGIGISADQQERIFGMFKRATDQRKGTGLGLYIVKDMLKAIGGKVELESEEGRGSTFTVTLRR